MKRRAYYATLFIVAAPLAFYFIPNRMMFGTWHHLRPDDFITKVNSRLVPIVASMKLYRVDNGALPSQYQDLVPRYLADNEINRRNRASIFDGKFRDPWSAYGESVEYVFTPGDEHWEVHGTFTNGVIPAPAVPDPLPRASTTRSTTSTPE